MVLARSGDLDGALATLATLNPARLSSTLDGLVREMTDTTTGPGRYGPGWLKVTIGADIYKIPRTLKRPDATCPDTPRPWAGSMTPSCGRG